MRLVLVSLLLFTAAAHASPVELGELRATPTHHSIGFEWPVTGDTNENATCSVRFKREGETTWRDALPLLRINYDWYYGKRKAETPANMLAGSIMFLTPGETYVVKLDATDPDGGDASREVTVQTKPWPQLPTGGRTIDAAPGSDLNAASDGDVVRLAPGDYGEIEITQDGVAFVGNGDARFDRIRVKASRVWIQGVHVKKREGVDGAGIYAPHTAADCVLMRNRIEGFKYCIALTPNCSGWLISDNVIIGDKKVNELRNTTSDIEGEGVELGKSPGHTVCYNRISAVADGVSYPNRDCDIFGNDIFDVTDDGIEPDFGFANIRMWHNRVTGFGENGISFQPMCAGPWYIVRNQLIGTWQPHTDRIPKAFKFRVLDRFVCVNNTFVVGKWITPYHSDNLFHALARNNLFISMTGSGQLWHASRDGSELTRGVGMALQSPDAHTDLDYNGYDWGDAGTPFWVQDHGYPNLEEFSQAFGVETHGKRVDKENIFTSWSIPAGPGRIEPHDLTLAPDGEAIDAGAPLPNIADDYTGEAPDLGAHEYGKPIFHVGPRPRPRKSRGADAAAEKE